MSACQVDFFQSPLAKIEVQHLSRFIARVVSFRSKHNWCAYNFKDRVDIKVFWVRFLSVNKNLQAVSQSIRLQVVGPPLSITSSPSFALFVIGDAKEKNENHRAKYQRYMYLSRASRLSRFIHRHKGRTKRNRDDYCLSFTLTSYNRL